MLKIYWFRKDLRTEDNTALSEFCRSAKQKDKVSFIYIKNTNSFSYFGEKRIRFLFQCLSSLNESLKANGFSLQVFHGKSSDAIGDILSKHGPAEIWFNRQVEPYCIARDNSVRELAEQRDCKVFEFDDTTMIPPGEVVNLQNEQYKVYTPFRNQLMKQICPADYEARRVRFPEAGEALIGSEFFEGERIREKDLPFRGGRKEALSLLKNFYGSGLSKYRSMRDFPGIKGTSRLSPHLHFGTISIREAYRSALKKQEECSSEEELNEVKTWVNELIWREFYYHVTYFNPQLTYKSFKEEFDNVQWNYDEEKLTRWKEGRTGFPIVDAGMRQLAAEGWMHNRVRMITAMFLTKDLLIDWRLGEEHFAEHLIDLDFSSNNGGWQWSASTGVDAQPYFRIFNPYLQSKKFDSDGSYIRQYVPELRQVPGEYIHEPHLMNEDLQISCNVRIGVDYPPPIVDHMKAKEEAVRRFSLAAGKTLNIK
ncbi:MAG: DNA photolyase family protein [Ignavibacteria bacterium]|nr:DNA photolyase family protein [Ignavibacteria bacterium]